MTGSALKFALVALMFTPTVAFADTIHFAADTAGSTEGLGDYTGSVSYDAGRLTLTLTNTSDADNGGWITALAFGQPGLGDDHDLGLSSTNSSFNLIYDPSVPPFSKLYEFGASTSDNWLGNGRGAGPPSAGIGVGETATFVFDFTGTELDYDAWTAASFVGPNPLLVRFRGFEDGGSDKVPSHPVPEPSTWAMGILTLLAVGVVRRRRD